MAPRSAWPAGLVVLLSCLLAGCGQSGPDKIRVHGTITFDGQAPPAEGVVLFRPIKAAQGFPSRPGRANFTQEDGTLEATTIKPGDGLLPGTYSVSIECWRIRPKDDGTPGVSYVRKGFSPPDLEIKPGADPIKLNLDVPTNR